MRWRPMRSDDLDPVHRLSRRAHKDYPEGREVFAERLALFPTGCRVLARAGEIGGYMICHPWVLAMAPPLNVLLGQLPAPLDCLHLHDIVIAPAWRGAGSARRGLVWLERLSVDMGLPTISLVAVAGTDERWRRLGFVPAARQDAATYGPGAMCMTKTIP